MANAPYYQVRSQFTNGTGNDIGTNAPFAPDDDYDLSASVTPSNHNASLYTSAQNSDSQTNTFEENRHLVELLEAATTATGQVTDALNMDSDMPQNKGKRKRVSSSPAAEDQMRPQGHVPSDPKRTRIDMPTGVDYFGSDPNLRSLYGAGNSTLHRSNETLLSDARAAGVHSAAALFRRTSKTTSRKYTRPPMSKLFVSLQLTPENFLHLQAQAKVYMLDATHPDRQSCVGNRGKGDTDMVKLRLFNCVRDFLNDGVGEHFFGENVEKPRESDAIEAAKALGEEKVRGEGKLVWPRDGNKIISLVTPLLRRMVTNERQRMYAIETRKGGTKRKEGSVESLSHDHGNDMGMEGITYQHQHLLHEQEHVQTALEPINTPLPPPVQAPTPSHYSHPPSPTSSTPIDPPASLPVYTHTQTPLRPVTATATANQAHARSSFQILNASTPNLNAKELALPTGNDTPNLHTIIIYLTKCGIKLRPIKRVENDSKVLCEYTLAELREEIYLLIQLALRTYPALRPSRGGMEPEALRGLAVAATEMGATDDSEARSPSAEMPLADMTNGIEHAQWMSPTSPSNQTLPFSAIPTDSISYTVQAMRSTGLSLIKQDNNWDEEAWLQVKKDVGCAVWAAGVMTLVVDLI